MIYLINRELKVEKETNGLYHLTIVGNFDLYDVSPKKTDTCRYYISFERGYLFVIERASGKMVLRGELKSKDQLKDRVIVGNWNIYNPPYKKTFFY